MQNVRLSFVKFLKNGHYKLAVANNDDNMQVPFLLKTKLFDDSARGINCSFSQNCTLL
jgi:hypothetical protein